MTRLDSRNRNLLAAAVAATSVVAVVELFARKAPDASLLVALTFFTMIVQGCVALVATAELAKGIWLVPVKRDLLGACPLILVAAALSLVLGAKTGIYPWSEHQNGWLNTRFFVIRNFIVLLAAYLGARKLSTAIRTQSPNKNRWAGLYIAIFIVSQSFVAFDWIMTLEYPWVSTLLGGFFFVEAVLMALAVSALVLFFRMRAPGHGLTETLRDTSKMMFGFSVMWVGFYFAQFLVIWYANIPEEVGFVLTRLESSPWSGLSRAVLFLVWVIPFVVLLSRPLKTVPAAMAGVACLILSGLFVEKLVLVLPAAKVGPGALALETILLMGLLAYFLASADRVILQRVAGTDPGGPQPPR
jgi:hypothetical protein